VAPTSFAAIGHVTNDHLSAGMVPGGSSLYATLTAAGLGLSARAVTSHGPDFVGRGLLEAAGVVVEGGGAARTTTFENVYIHGSRHARVLAVADLLAAPATADIVLACPVVDEVAPSALAGPLVGAGLQGWFRRLGPGGVVERRIPDDLGFLAPCRAAFVSVEDLGDDGARVLPALRATVPIVVVTDGPRGATIYAAGGATQIGVYPADEVDPTGAGDVFATAFLIALARGEDVETAGAFGAAAASIVVEGVGPSALCRLGETSARYTRLRGPDDRRPPVRP
jgi:1D-myo-inositol 3-kinase